MDGSDPKSLELPEEFQQKCFKNEGEGVGAVVTGTVIKLVQHSLTG